MSDPFSVDFNQDRSNGHPHDLLARLYREIGISAVAAALEATHFTGQPADIAPVSIDEHRSTLIEAIQENIAA
jgi:hypothetical protein